MIVPSGRVQVFVAPRRVAFRKGMDGVGVPPGLVESYGLTDCSRMWTAFS